MHKTTTNSIVSSGACPRCKTPLIDPGGLGWCKACGYCKSLADSEQKTVTAEAAPASKSVGTFKATGSALTQTPTWVWVLLGGVVVVAGMTIALGILLTLSPLERALLTTVQSLVAVAVILCGQFVGLMKIAPEESTLNFWDAIFPFRLYGLLFKRLPATRLTLYLGAWGLAAVITANLAIGGLGHWMTYLPQSAKQGPQKTKAK